MSYSTIEQELDSHGTCLFQTVGDSMEPLLHNRCSTIAIKKFSGRLKKYDVALYKRPTGQYVLHRVLAVKKGYYIICGDNRVHLEKVPEEWILGVMTGFYAWEDSQFISCEEEIYKKYIEGLKFRYIKRWILVLPDRIINKLRRL